jgi:hypothetical protein
VSDTDRDLTPIATLTRYWPAGWPSTGGPSIERQYQRARNVVIVWVDPDLPNPWRTIILVCLKTRRY